ncbi:MAG: P-loop NTPase fold protein [Proteobacteria bacterium]|nr:P-loop NTPase fold protein [Pseudomonadota bacterium]
MAKKLRTLREIERDELALQPPRMRILNDRPLAAAEAHQDSLRLATKLAPVYDILRHPETETPLAVAIYGDWGTGKTSAMQWLEGLLIEWNKRGEHGKKGVAGKIVRPVWFYPWKYHKKEDVWRGLIAEVILASIDVRGATVERIKTAFKQFGLFLGRSFLHALSSLRLVEGVDARSLQGFYDEYRRATHPEAGYLNEFESTLGRWIRDTISDADERMVVFIDDLDRCLPEVALQVLEALKLYLNIDDLIFVVGVDRTVIDQLIQKLYGDLGLDRQKSRKYLAKMFQIEVAIGPTDRLAEEFLDEQLAVMSQHDEEYWTSQLTGDERDLFRLVVLRLAQRNPREIKRMLNSALIHGAGVLHFKEKRFSFAQGMQVFLVRRVLDERYTMGLSVDTKAGMEFFHRWSHIVRGGAAVTVQHPEDLARRLAGQGDSGADATDAELSDDLGVLHRDGRQAPETPYAQLLTERRFARLRRLLADRDLGELMRVEYPADTRALAESYVQDLPQGLIREAIARQRRKSPVELTAADYELVFQLDLEGAEIVDISPLQALTALRDLDLSFTQVADLSPLAGLTGLESLSLTNTPAAELGPLRHLDVLQSLSLANTRVGDIGALHHLSYLSSLNLRGTRIGNIDALRGLAGLRSLSLANTDVTDLEPLQLLTSLQSLSLVNLRVADLAPIEKLTELRYLYLSHTDVADLSPLAGFIHLQSLSLIHTPITDLTALHQLRELQFVDMQGIAATDKAIEEFAQQLPNVEIRR